MPEPLVLLWLITHPDLRRVARIRAVLDELAAGLVAAGAAEGNGSRPRLLM
jgi:hypothetical protein